MQIRVEADRPLLGSQPKSLREFVCKIVLKPLKDVWIFVEAGELHTFTQTIEKEISNYLQALL
jgi:hypothetical protein